MLLKTALISSILFLVACADDTLPKFPDIKEIHEVDAVRSKCIPYPVTNIKPIEIGDPGQPKEMIECDGYVAIKYKDFLGLKEFKRQADKFAEDHKRRFKN